MSELISVKLIKQDSRLQPRAKMDTAIIDEYTESMKAGAKFPAVVVYRVGEDYFLVDGYHRYLAVQGAKFDKILAEVRDGTMRDAILFSAGVNATHGIRRTNDDKRRAVLILLRDNEWSAWNNQQIAKAANVSDELVRKIRAEIQTEKSTSPAVSSNVGKIPSKKILVERSGKTYKMDSSNIGKSKPTSNTGESKPTKVGDGAKETPGSEKEPQTDHIVDANKSIPAQPSLAAQQAGTKPPEPPKQHIVPCKGGGGCPYGKFATEKIRGSVCTAVGQPINQIDTCPRESRNQNIPMRVDSGFETGNGKKDFVTPKVPDAVVRPPTNEKDLCEAFLRVVLDNGPEADFVRRLADTEFNGDVAQAEREIHIRVSAGGA